MSKHIHISKDGSHTIGRAVLVAGIIALLWRPAPLWAGRLTCLTGTDPSVANDAGLFALAREEIDTACVCSSFDGSHGKAHREYVKCTKGAINSLISPLRPQCNGLVKKYYATSTCGIPASKGVVPCIKKTTAGKVTCAIKPAAKCTGKPGKYAQTACPNATLCIDAADTNHDALIGTGDSGACNSGGTCANGGIPIGAPCGTCGNGVCCGQGAPCPLWGDGTSAELCFSPNHDCISATAFTGDFGCPNDAFCDAANRCVANPTTASCGTIDSFCYAKCAE